MRAFIQQQVAFTSSEWPLGSFGIDYDEPKFGPMYRKVIVGRGDFASFDPNTVTWLGGLCSLFTGDGEAIRKSEQRFTDVRQFFDWISTWYPRLDQVHDTLGIPPAACRRAIYVVEDSIWARRIARWTSLPSSELAVMLRSVHETQGKVVIERWLKNFGYNGQVEVVYTSTIERELDAGLRIWERLRGTPFKKKESEQAKVEIMYTPLWLDILGVSRGIIAEPAHHGTILPCNIPPQGLFQIGYLPFWDRSGPTRLLPVDRVIHRGNWQDFSLSTDDQSLWGAINLAFHCRNPFGFEAHVLQERILRDLQTLYAPDEGRQ